jgi:hypothetical protein
VDEAQGNDFNQLIGGRNRFEIHKIYWLHRSCLSFVSKCIALLLQLNDTGRKPDHHRAMIWQLLLMASSSLNDVPE